ncbi:hypothetical protein KPH14_002652 [Odynerus spinipes]|uniref:Uncharacterized protein n=1 Tax=Odynerus spinipes TaxID=1348599 RepID=A0AAD9RGU0_9HYME|nr:hypothetical protein KPH14_002652 [Odynerus spinipes]
MKSHRKRGERGGKGSQKRTEYKEEQQILIQPKQSYAAYEDNIETKDDSKDFESLITAPTSANGQLTFKSEKNWSADVSGCFEYFTLDLKLLSAAMKCIPFNECVQIGDKYFTADQLTNFHNAAEEGKEAYKNILSNLEISNSSSIVAFKESLENGSKERPEKSSNLTNEMQDTNDYSDNLDEDLDFLLSLESPTVQSDKKQVTLTSILHNDVIDHKIQSGPLPTKPIDLESWLDLILDD